MAETTVFDSSYRTTQPNAKIRASPSPFRLPRRNEPAKPSMVWERIMQSIRIRPPTQLILANETSVGPDLIIDHGCSKRFPRTFSPSCHGSSSRSLTHRTCLISRCSISFLSISFSTRDRCLASTTLGCPKSRK